jgi:hypothetical protein
MAGTRLTSEKERFSYVPGNLVAHDLKNEGSDVITGWVEALTMMKAGSTWKLCVPGKLTYGAKGSNAVGPDFYEPELTSVLVPAK